jgi:hypothetical protein
MTKHQLKVGRKRSKARNLKSIKKTKLRDSLREILGILKLKICGYAQYAGMLKICQQYAQMGINMLIRA